MREIRLADERANAFGAVDDLGNADVGGGAEIGERGGARYAVRERKKPNRAAGRDSDRFVQIRMKPRNNPVPFRFAEKGKPVLLAGCGDFGRAFFENSQADHGVEGSLEGAERDFAVAHGEMRIAQKQQRPVHLNWKVEDGADAKLPDVDVAAAADGRSGMQAFRRVRRDIRQRILKARENQIPDR